MTAEVVRLRSELWRVYEVLGFDTDGDTHHSVIDLGDTVIAAAERFRQESEEEQNRMSYLLWDIGEALKHELYACDLLDRVVYDRIEPPTGYRP